MKKNFGVVFVFMAASLWATMSVFVRLFNNSGLFAMEIVELRCIVTSLLIIAVTFVGDRSLLKIKIKDWWCFFGAGAIGVAFFNYCYFKTIYVTDIAVASILLYTAPIFVMLISIVVFKEKLTKIKVASIIIAFTGCILVSGFMFGNKTLTPKGFFIGLCAGIGYALYTIFSKVALEKGYCATTVTIYTFLFGSIGGMFFTSFTDISTYMTENGIGGLLFCIVVAAVATTIPNNLYAYGLKCIESSKAAVISFIDPVISATLAFFIFREVPSGTSLIGMGLIIFALFLLNKDVFIKAKA
jgi:drug/metabolite transporter (DMT)-like permease